MASLFRAFVDRHPHDWLERLVNDYKIIATTAGELISLKYNQIESPMDDALVAECRGLVVHERGELLAWPYGKFWNLGERLAAPIDWSTARVQDKLDGSLMILYLDHYSEWAVASSGHPVAGGSYGAATRTFADAFWETWRAEGMVHPHHRLANTSIMFELVSPENRIVCKYDRPQLICHGARDMVSGQELARAELEAICKEHSWAIVAEYDLDSAEACLSAAASLDPTRHEGFIVVDARGNRVKIKSPRYVALHHLRGSGAANARRAIELWQAGEVGELLAHFPEMAPDVQPVLDTLDDLARHAAADLRLHHGAPDRKTFALAVKDHPWAGITFALYRMFLAGEFRIEAGAEQAALGFMREMSVVGLERMIDAVRTGAA